jgi:hypothetical protein
VPSVTAPVCHGTGAKWLGQVGRTIGRTKPNSGLAQPDDAYADNVGPDEPSERYLATGDESLYLAGKEHYEQALAGSPDYAEPHVLHGYLPVEFRGEAGAGPGDPDGALADWRHSFELDPECLSPVYGSAFLLERQGLHEAIGARKVTIDWAEARGYVHDTMAHK